MMHRISILALIITLGAVSGRESLSCRNEQGVAVDWFITYKIPYLQQDPSKILRSGFAYAFISGPTLGSMQRQREIGWTLSSKLITEDDCIFAQTLNPLYTDRNSYTHLMYSDSPPENSSSE